MKATVLSRSKLNYKKCEVCAVNLFINRITRDRIRYTSERQSAIEINNLEIKEREREREREVAEAAERQRGRTCLNLSRSFAGVR